MTYFNFKEWSMTDEVDINSDEHITKIKMAILERGNTDGDDVFENSQQVRMELVNSVLDNNGGQAPKNPETLNALRGLLSDMEKSVSVKKRLQMEEKASDSDNKLIDAIVAQMGNPSQRLGGSRNRDLTDGAEKLDDIPVSEDEKSKVSKVSSAKEFLESTKDD